MPERTYINFDQVDNRKHDSNTNHGGRPSFQGLKRKRGHGYNSTNRVPGDSNGFRKTPGTKLKGIRNVPKAGQVERPSRLTPEQRALCQERKKLPIYPVIPHVQIRIRGETDVMIIAGETGSGKSTQVPQCLLREEWCKKKVAVTQPRRVAAISLARRVAEEMFTTLGKSSPASKVGYSVRFDNNVAAATRIKFLTEGMLLQEMLRDPWLTQYSAVVVDEVHERSVNVDLILGFLRRIVAGDKRGRKGELLKVIIMSATVSTRDLAVFFHEAFEGPIDGSTGSAQTKLLSDGGSHDDAMSESSWEGFPDSEDEATSRLVTL